MKKILTLLLLSSGIIGCSNIQLEAVSTSAEETQKILAMGLTHEENLIEADKIESDHMRSVVKLQLVNKRDKKIQDDIDQIESQEYANKVLISSDGLNFKGPELITSKKTGVLEDEIDQQSFFLKGTRNSITGLIKHNLTLKVSHNSKNQRNYFSANLCDEWLRCDGNKRDIIVDSVSASKCSTSSCNYEEVIYLSLSDDFLEEVMDKGFTMRFNSKRRSNKVTISKSYLMGYLEVINQI